MNGVRYRRNPDALWRIEHPGADGDGPAALIHLDTDIVTINGVGLDVWRLCDGATLDEIVDRLVDEYDVDRQTLAEDVASFLGELEERRVLLRD